MVDFSIVAQWLEKAAKDLSIAATDIKDSKRAEYVAFNCQQSAEKYLKAYIIANDLKFKYTHDLVELLRICVEKDKDFNKLKRYVEELTPFYIESRYPDLVGAITYERARLALSVAKKIAKFVEDKIK